MTVFKGSGFYHVGAVNTNRQVFIQIVAQGGVSDVFKFLKGNNAFHPWTDAIAAPVSTNDKIAQYRVDYIVRALSIYSIPVFVSIADVDVNGGETGNAVQIGYETYVSNVLPATTDIVDSLGMADRAAKTKDGLQTLATGLITTASLDGGGVSGTLLYAINPHLADGTVSSAVAITTLTVSMLTPSMY